MPDGRREDAAGCSDVLGGGHGLNHASTRGDGLSCVRARSLPPSGPPGSACRRSCGPTAEATDCRGPRGAGKTWLMLRAIEWIEEGDEDGRARPGIGLWYPSPSEYDSLAFLASLSERLATSIEGWYWRDRAVHRRRVVRRAAVVSAAVAGFVAAVPLVAGLDRWQQVAFVLVAAGAEAAAALGVFAWRARWSGWRLRDARVLRERARYSVTQRRSSR